MKRLLLLLFLLFSLLLAACGNTSSSTANTVSSASSPGTSSSAGPSGGSTPASGGAPTILNVTRTDPSLTNNLGPLNKNVTDVATVQKLYQMAQALPTYDMQSTISQDCLNDTGVIYHLDFLQGSTVVQHMNLDPGNCKILYLSQTDLRVVSAAFLTLLQQAIQVASLT